ncbi:MAG: carbohydrate binding family 9 domain-containing protein, partial [Sedimentisphaerales bacterium]
MKHSRELYIALSAIILLINARPVQARGPARSIAAVRTDTPPVIDGKIDDACWSQANVSTDFIDYRTEQLAVEQTFVRVLYDNENVYIAFECLEPDPNRIVAIERRYDQSLREEDYVSVRLDTFHDHRCAYIFTTNTLGTRYDARIGLFGYDDTWGCDWLTACSVEKDRWFAEIAIPIGNMRFEPKNDVTWGVNFSRTETSRHER